jgi:hypothetical protein
MASNAPLPPQRLDDAKLIEILIDQRNEHINRLYSLNGQIALLVLTVSGSILFGVASNIDKFSNVHAPTSCGLILLLIVGLLSFLLSIASILFAILHHGRERSAAACKIEGTIRDLLETCTSTIGTKALGDLDKAIADDLEMKYKETPPRISLATELNSKWFGFSLYQKTTLGCGFLLVASIAISIVLVEGYQAIPSKQQAMTCPVPDVSEQPVEFPAPNPAPLMSPRHSSGGSASTSTIPFSTRAAIGSRRSPAHGPATQ